MKNITIETTDIFEGMDNLELIDTGATRAKFFELVEEKVADAFSCGVIMVQASQNRVWFDGENCTKQHEWDADEIRTLISEVWDDGEFYVNA